MTDMKKAKIVTAMTATVLALNLAGVNASAQEVNTTQQPTVGVTETTTPVLPEQDEVTVKLEDNKTYTYKVKVREGASVSFAANTFVPRADGETGLPPEYLDHKDKLTLVVKDSTGKVVGEASFYDHIFITEGLKLDAGEYTVEVTTKEGLAKEGSVLEVAYYAEGGVYTTFIEGIETSLEGDDIQVGKELTLKGTGVIGASLTQVSLITPNGEEEKVVQDYSPNGEYTFTPTEEGYYTATFKIKNEETGEEAETVQDFYVNPKDTGSVTPPVDGENEGTDEEEEKPTKPSYTKASGLKMSIAKTTVKPKSTVTVNHSAKGTAVKYKVAIKQKGERNKVVKDYTSSKKVAFKAPSKKGKYIVSVYAKSSKGGKAVHTTKVITVK